MIASASVEPILPKPDDLPAPVQGRQLFFRAWWLVPLLIVAVCATGIFLLWFSTLNNQERDRTDAERRLETDAANLTRAFGEHILRTVGSIDQTLLLLRQVYLDNPADFPKYQKMTQETVFKDFEVEKAIIGPDGFLAYSSVAGIGQMDLSDREHFLVHRDRASDELFISKPVQGRASGKWSIQFTRRLTAQDGAFGGVIVVSADPDYFSKFFESIDVGKEGAVTLIGMDRVIRARASGTPAPINPLGITVTADRPFFDPSQPAFGHYRASSVVDGVERFGAWRRLEEYPLVVLILISVKERFAALEAGHRGQLIDTYIITTAIALFGLALIWLMSRQHATQVDLKREIAGRAEIERLRNEERVARLDLANKSKDRFLASMSHELRTPLNAIIGFSQMIEGQFLGKMENQKYVEYAENVRKSGEHLLGIIEDILDISRIDAGKVELQMEDMNARDIWNFPIANISVLANNKSIVLKTDFPDTPAFVRANLRAANQCLTNILGNAIKFTPAGGTVTCRTEVVNGQVLFVVEDTGRGIDPEYLSRLGIPFELAGDPLLADSRGTGLGLAISKKLAALMGGNLEIASELGKGTHVTIRLPASRH